MILGVQDFYSEIPLRVYLGNLVRPYSLPGPSLASLDERLAGLTLSKSHSSALVYETRSVASP
jgi:hypothetical protein